MNAAKRKMAPRALGPAQSRASVLGLSLPALVAFLALSGLSPVSAGSYCSLVLPQLCITGSLTPSNLTDILITTPPNLWWLALSIGTGMPGSDLMAFFPKSGSSSEIQASDRHARAYTTPIIDATNDIILLPDSQAQADGSMRIHFQRALVTPDIVGDRPFLPGRQGYGFAWRNGPIPPREFEETMDLGVHDGHESMIFDLVPGEATGGEVSGGLEGLDTLNAVLVAHGAVMYLAWIGLIPVGTWVARYGRGKGWFKVHWFIQYPSLLLALIGLALSITYLTLSSLPQFKSTHSIMGITVIFLALIQGGLGAYIHANRVADGPRPKRNWVHRLLGPVVWILAVATVVLGYLRYGAIYALPNSTFAPQLFLGIGWVVAWIVAGEAYRISTKLGDLRKAKGQSVEEIVVQTKGKDEEGSVESGESTVVEK